MIKAAYSDKGFITDILVDSFYDNSSVNYIIRQDEKKKTRIRSLMNYSFDVCYYFGEVFYSEDRKGCALVLFPDKKRKSLRSILLDLKFILSCLDITHLQKAMERESKIKALQPNGLKYYLWFIGVQPSEQGKGIGTRLLNEVMTAGCKTNRFLLLETSNIHSVRWYKKSGFQLYNTLDLGYLLYFLKCG